MASHILPFRTSRSSRTISPHSPFARRGTASPASAEAASAEPEGGGSGPRLAYSRPAALRPAASQASRASWHIDQELLARVQEDIAQRNAGRQAFLSHQRYPGGSLPAQATAVGLRQRLFDALFFPHPA